MITNKHKNTVDIILQPRLGDAILSLPAIICLKQLNIKYERNLDIRVVSTFPGMTKLLKTFDTGKNNQMSLYQKAKSWIFQTDKAFFLAPTTKNWGYKAKETYGRFNSFRKYVKYTYDAEYVAFSTIHKTFPPELINFLKEKFGFSTVTISIFGVCLDLGFTAEQIIETFKFNTDIFNFKNKSLISKPPLEKNSYVVFCMEAANNRPVDSDRRWSEQNYLEIAEKIYQNYGIKSAFIGLNKKSPLPEKTYVCDLRGKLDLVKLAQILKLSKGYIGNDTGPLHMNNLMHKPSVGVYFREESTKDFTPIFPQLNRIILKPESVEEVFSHVEFLLG